MLEFQETYTVNASLQEVWAYASNMENWAANMPGFQSFEQLDDRESRWRLKVAVGPFARTVIMSVLITEWQEPERVGFNLHSENDPVQGTGSFVAELIDDAHSRVTMRLELTGSGRMAGTMEALMRPVLPRMGKSFADALVREIEQRQQAG